MGALVVGWALFEHRLEQAIWRLRGDDVAGRRPDTDTMPASDRIKLFRSLSAPIETPEWQETAALFCDTCENVLFVRNLLAHGHLLPAAAGGGMINNISWGGVVRRRPFQSLHVTEQTLGLVLEALGELLRAVGTLLAINGGDREAAFIACRKNLRGAQSMSGEVRHLAELMDHEKY